MTRTRFAPAPTGLLHLGHVANAVYVWGLARRHGAAVLLRIEDHDRQRSRPEFERALLDDLDWLGFRPDGYPTGAFRAGRCESRQQDRAAVYEAAAAPLVDRGLVHACACSRQAIEQARAGLPGDEVACPGGCRERTLPLDGDVAWRVTLAGGTESFDDLLLGPQTQPVPNDVVIRDRHGNWTYQFAVAVDDFDQGVDLVVRGQDLLDSTARQLALARLIGRTSWPVFAHHPLLWAAPGRKLSKSDGSTGVRDLRAQGWTPARVIGEAAARAGLAAPGAALSADAVAGLFSAP